MSLANQRFMRAPSVERLQQTIDDNRPFLPVVAERELIDLTQWVKINSQDLATDGSFSARQVLVGAVTATVEAIVDLDRLQEFSLNPVR